MSGGWHPDPFFRYAQRYHDGDQWTDHVSNIGGVSEEDPLGTQPSPPGFPVAPPIMGTPVARTVPGFDGLPGGRWARLGAATIDSLVTGVVLIALSFALFDIHIDLDALSSDDPDVVNSAIDIPIGALMFATVGSALYGTVMVGRWGATLGKMACGLCVVRRSDASAPGYGVAAVRAVAYGVLYGIPYAGNSLAVISNVSALVMIIMIFAHPLRQTPHDLIASTVVAKSWSVRRDPASPGPR